MKKILFVGGLYNCRFFKANVEYCFESFGTKIKFKECKEVHQKDIDWCDIIIGYSFAIQYINRLDVKHKKLILVNPLLNNYKIKNWMIEFACKYIKWRKKFGIEIQLVFNLFGCDTATCKLWYRDMIEWINKYDIKEEIQNIKPKKNWIILEGKSPVCKLDRIDGKVYDNKGKLCKHFINFDNDFNFIKNWIK